MFLTVLFSLIFSSEKKYINWAADLVGYSLMYLFLSTCVRGRKSNVRASFLELKKLLEL